MEQKWQNAKTERQNKCWLDTIQWVQTLFCCSQIEWFWRSKFRALNYWIYFIGKVSNSKIQISQINPCLWFFGFAIFNTQNEICFLLLLIMILIIHFNSFYSVGCVGLDIFHFIWTRNKQKMCVFFGHSHPLSNRSRMWLIKLKRSAANITAYTRAHALSPSLHSQVIQ